VYGEMQSFALTAAIIRASNGLHVTLSQHLLLGFLLISSLHDAGVSFVCKIERQQSRASVGECRCHRSLKSL